MASQVEDGVGNQLAGTVEGEVAAAKRGVEGREVQRRATEEGLLGWGDIVGWFGMLF